jgi:hypothetical protein
MLCDKAVFKKLLLLLFGAPGVLLCVGVEVLRAGVRVLVFTGRELAREASE